MLEFVINDLLDITEDHRDSGEAICEGFHVVR